MAALKSLPPHKFMTKTSDGRISCLYADPTICACVYVGDSDRLRRYRQSMAARQTATDEQIRAILSSSPLPGRIRALAAIKTCHP